MKESAEMKLQKTNQSGYVKDMESGTVLNTDEGAYEVLKAHRQKRQTQNALEKKLDEVEADVAEIKKDMIDIRDGIQKLLEMTSTKKEK